MADRLVRPLFNKIDRSVRGERGRNDDGSLRAGRDGINGCLMVEMVQ
jgi:hypothetical protein